MMKMKERMRVMNDVKMKQVEMKERTGSEQNIRKR